MKSDGYFVIQGWMCNELELKGNDLLIFAIIHSFSQDGKSRFNGGRRYLAETLNVSNPTIDKSLQNLLNRGLIIKESSGDHINTDRYYSNSEMVIKLREGSKETLLGGSKETLPNNKYIINKDILSNDNIHTPNGGVTGDCLNHSPRGARNIPKDTVSKPKKKNLYEKCMDLIDETYEDREVRELLQLYLKVRLERKETPLGFNSFKGMINKLIKMSDSKQDCLAIIQQSIDLNYLSFFPVRSYRGNGSGQRNKFSETVRTASVRVREEDISDEEF